MTRSSELFPPEPAAAVDAEAELLARVQLSLVPKVGPRLTALLLERFGSAHAVLHAPVRELEQVSRITAAIARNIAARADCAEAREQMERCASLGIRLLASDRPDYPPPLARTDDPPSFLYGQGEWQPADELAIAIVGSRHCTTYGEKIAGKLAEGLARAGVTVVSGLARGIDGCAHRACLNAGGRTIAVLGSGLAKLYPPEHAGLARDIAGQGMLLTEYAPDHPPMAGQFPQRNRLISGLSLGVIVVEASRKSGALHTARHAMEQNREVFAVPGRIDSDASAGCHDLIRDGATLIRDVDDVLQSLGPLAKPVTVSAPSTPPVVIRQPRELKLSDQETLVLNLVAAEQTPIDDVIAGSKLEPSRVLSTLTILEMKRLIRRLPGNFLVRQ